MRKTIACLMVVVLLAVSTGCANLGAEKVDPTKIALAYYEQERTYEPIKVSGVQSITLEAADGQSLEVTLTTPLEPLSIYPRDPATLKTMLDGLADLATVIAAGVVGYGLVDAISTDPTIVEPTVVQVPVAE